MWGYIICGLLLLIFAPTLLALIGVVAIPIIIIFFLGIIGAFIYVMFSDRGYTKLYKKNNKEYLAKLEELKIEFANMPFRELEKLMFDSYQNLNSTSERIPSKYKYGTIEYEERSHDRNMRITVVMHACELLYSNIKSEELKKEYASKTIQELKSMKEEEIRSFERFEEESKYKYVSGLNTYKRKLENTFKLKALTDLIQYY